MKLLKALLVLILITANGVAFAQLTARLKNDSASVNFGTRPRKGDKSLMMSINLRDSSMKIVRGSDLLKLSDKLIYKYYIKDNLVFRVSAKIARDRKASTGTIADSSYYNNLVKPHLDKNKTVVSASEFIIMPGLEKHCSALNMFDVYFGTDVLLGLGVNRLTNNTTFTNGDYSNIKITDNYNLLGINPFAGFNIFVGKLPLSLGLEYSWTGLWKLNDKLNVSQQDQITVGSQATAYNAEYAMQQANALGVVDNNKYSKLSRTEFTGGLNQVIKFTANIYFK